MQLLFTHNPLTYLHSQSHHSKFTHTAILVLTNPYTATIGYFSSLNRFLTKTGTHTNYYQDLTHHIVYKYQIF